MAWNGFSLLDEGVIRPELAAELTAEFTALDKLSTQS
jgi:hypothetical protein